MKKRKDEKSEGRKLRKERYVPVDLETLVLADALKMW